MTAMVGAAVLGVLVLLLLGGLLALTAAWLPRLLLFSEGEEARRLSLEDLEPAPIGHTEMGPPRIYNNKKRPVTNGAPELAGSWESGGPEEPLVAAAIALALALHQGEPLGPLVTPTTSTETSSWALAGRWQAMQARLNLSKR